jgi:hypothetical protein
MAVQSPARHLARAALAALALAPLAQPDVLVVDDDGPGPYLDLQSAVDTAAEGDVILIEGGTYGAVDVVGKSLVLTADLGEIVNVNGRVSVRQLAASQVVVIRGLTVQILDQGAPQVLLTGNAGFVLLEDCAIGTTSAINPALPLRVEQSLQAALVRCELRGSQSFFFPLPTGPAVEVSGSILYAYDSTFVGGNGNATGAPDSEPGGDGAVVSDAGVLFASRSIFAGGAGGSVFSFPLPGGPGGDAIQASGGSAVVLLGATLQPGPGGFSQFGPDGPPGLPLRLLSGAVSASVPGAPRSFAAESPVRAGASAALGFRGQAGDLALVALSAVLAPLPSLPLAGVVFLAAPLLGIQIHGTLPDDQPFASSLSPPPLPPGMLELQVHLQGAFLTSAGAIRLGPASTLVVLDPSV